MEEHQQLKDRFFSALAADPDAPQDIQEALRAWLWFTCPAHLRYDTERLIRQDPRFSGNKKEE